jgi:hypothetical protein
MISLTCSASRCKFGCMLPRLAERLPKVKLDKRSPDWYKYVMNELIKMTLRLTAELLYFAADYTSALVDMIEYERPPEDLR